MASDLLIQLIASELKNTPLGSDVDIIKYKDKLTQIIVKLDKNTVDQINIILQGNSTFLNTCIFNVQEILKDNKINIEDIPYFLNIIKALHDEATQFTQSKTAGIIISPNTMFSMCDILINIILVLTINDPTQLTIAQQMTESALSLARFSIPMCGFFKCC